MSRNFNKWSRPRSRPSSRSRGRNWGNQVYDAPRGLRGKELGLYYRNLQAKKQKTDPMINLRIPEMVMQQLDNSLRNILKIASQQNISLPKLEQLDIFKNNTSLQDESKQKISFEDIKNRGRENNAKYQDKNFDEAGPSCSDFIPIKDENIEYGSQPKVLALRRLCDYKYGYEDIITGTFQEKLDDCLRNGVSINFVDTETVNLNTALYIEYQDMLESNAYKQMLKFREKLPAYVKAKEIIDKINENQVLVISGETGCGKSTQVPQIILDNAICNNRGANVKILVTQPRRIAASALAMRVAKERGEPLGNSVGYAVRLERVEERSRGSIQFCTTGILLADLEVDQGLTKYSHIILDEVHERDVHIDLSMCILKQVLSKRKDLKLILMSATLDAETLSNYYENCPLLHIEGLAYPVEDIYLEDILKLTKYRLPPEEQQKPKPKWMKYRNKNLDMQNDMEKDILYKQEIWPWLESLKDKMSYDVYKTLQDSRIERLNLDLVVEVLTHISKDKPGAILVFLPGIGEITKLMRLMDESNRFPPDRFEIYPLHSKLPTLEQHKIFEKPPKHMRKIIIATNIAETSITIDDIVYVVDCGKIKISGLNVEKNQSTLAVEWVAKANLHQRRGRAGRCQPGICYHLLTSYRAQAIKESLLPELQRSNLLEPVLMIKKLRLGFAADALKLVPSVPADSTVQWAVTHLQKCGALDDIETLTPLGWHLARLPVHPAAGKLLILGALFGCLDRAASVAAVWGFKDPFQLVIGKESEVDKVKRELAMGEPSDHVAVSEAILLFEQCNYRKKRSFAYEHFLSYNTIELLTEMKKQLGDNLRQMGFLTTGNIRSSWENRNANNLSLFKAIVAASLYPNIASVKWKRLNKGIKPATFLARNQEDGKLTIHPSSVMAMGKIRKGSGYGGQLCNNPGANWLVYWLKQRSTDLFLLDVTLIYTLPLLFFGEFMVCDDIDDPDHCLLAISHVKVRCQRSSANKLFQLRCLLDKVLASKITDSAAHSTKNNEFEEQVLNTVIQIITAEDEQTEYIDDLQDSDTSES